MTRAAGQTLTEYALIIGVVLAAVTGMQTYIKRGIQSSLKVAADQIGDQQRGLQYEAGDRVGSVPGTTPSSPGTVLEQQSSTRTYTKKNVDQLEKDWGQHCSDLSNYTAGGTCKEYKAADSDTVKSVGSLDPNKDPQLPRDLPPGSSSHSVVIQSRSDQ